MGRDNTACSSWTSAVACSSVGDAGDDEGELVAAEARHGRLLRARPLEPLGDLEQEPVTDGVAQRVVDVLEAVEVEEDDGDARALVQRGRGAVVNSMRFGSPVSMSCVAWCDLLSTS